jgi:pimeloyl-ACP methyl ester carboxylesterase
MKPMQPITVRMGEAWRGEARAEWLEGWTTRRVPLEGGTADCVDTGAGPPLVLLPPLPGFKEAFAPCARLLARSFRVVSPDLRVRFARSAPPAARWRELTRDLERLCDHLGLGEVAVAGHSLGGALAQHWAFEHPRRVRALVLSSTFARVTTPPGAGAARYVEQPLVLAAQRLLPRGAALALARSLARRHGWVYDPRCDDAVLALVRHAIRACPARVAAACVRMALIHDTRAHLGQLRAPVRLLVGEADTPFARVAARDLLARIPGATLEVSPGAGHLHPLSSPAWFALQIEDLAHGTSAPR